MYGVGLESKLIKKNKGKMALNLDKCDIKGCEKSWTHRVCILDMCDFHYDLWIRNGGQKK